MADVEREAQLAYYKLYAAPFEPGRSNNGLYLCSKWSTNKSVRDREPCGNFINKKKLECCPQCEATLCWYCPVCNKIYVDTFRSRHNANKHGITQHGHAQAPPAPAPARAPPAHPPPAARVHSASAHVPHASHRASARASPMARSTPTRAASKLAAARISAAAAKENQETAVSTPPVAPVRATTAPAQAVPAQPVSAEVLPAQSPVKPAPAHTPAAPVFEPSEDPIRDEAQQLLASCGLALSPRDTILASSPSRDAITPSPATAAPQFFDLTAALRDALGPPPVTAPDVLPIFGQLDLNSESDFDLVMPIFRNFDNFAPNANFSFTV